MIDIIMSAADTLVSFLAATEYDSDGSPGWLLLAGPAGAAAVYGMLYRYYRNTDKSHQYEQDTVIESQPITGSDAKIDEVRGTKRTSIHGNNKRNHRDRVQRVE